MKKGEPKLTQVTLGPPVPLVPITHFGKFRFKKSEWEDAWQIVGPSVDNNIRRNVPLWMVITAAYLEGLSHGAAIVTDAGDTGSIQQLILD